MIQIFDSSPKWPGGEIMHYLIPPIAIKPLSRPKTSSYSKTSNALTSIPSSRVRPPTTTSRCPSPPQSSWTWTVSISLGLKPRTSAFSFVAHSYDRTTVQHIGASVKLDMNCKQESLFPPNFNIQSNLAIRNVLKRNLLVLRNHFPWPICHLLRMNKEHLALRNNFRVTKKFLIAKFDCSSKVEKI